MQLSLPCNNVSCRTISVAQQAAAPGAGRGRALDPHRTAFFKLAQEMIKVTEQNPHLVLCVFLLLLATYVCDAASYLAVEKKRKKSTAGEAPRPLSGFEIWMSSSSVQHRTGQNE